MFSPYLESILPIPLQLLLSRGSFIGTFNNGRRTEMFMVRQQKIKVAELFAGVGGFRLGLERIGVARNLRNRKRNTNFKVVWSNQFEPKTNKQHALIFTLEF